MPPRFCRRWSSARGRIARHPLSIAVEGPCGPNLGVLLQPDRTLVTYGAGLATMATIDEHGVHDVSMLPDVNAPFAILGRWPDHAWYLHDEGFRCTESHQLRKWTNGQWKDIALSPLKDHPGNLVAYALVGDGLLYSETDSFGCGGEAGDKSRLEADGTRVPQIADDGAEVEELAGFPTGEVFAIVRGTTTEEVRFVSAAGNVQKEAHRELVDPDCARTERCVRDDRQRAHDGDALRRTGVVTVAATARRENDLVVRARGGPVLVVGDGQGASCARMRAARGAICTRRERRVRSSAFPKARRGSCSWTGPSRSTTAQSGHPYLCPNLLSPRTRTSLRRASSCVTRAMCGSSPGTEKEIRPGAKDSKNVEVRSSGPSPPTRRCAAAARRRKWRPRRPWSGASSRGPPAVSDSCTTPLVLLTDHGPLDPPTDFPRSRALLAKHPEFAGAVYEEIAAGEHRYFAAKAPNVQMARALLALYAKKTYGSMPHIVCADPPATRTFDVASGANDAGAGK